MLNLSTWQIILSSRLLDVQLERCVEKGMTLDVASDNSVLDAILALLDHDGLTR